MPSDGEVAELQHLRVLCGAQGGRIEQLIGQLAAREEESERQIRVIRHEKVSVGGGRVERDSGEGEKRKGGGRVERDGCEG